MDPYETLGVPKDADAATIKKAHRRRVRETHPDAGGKTEEFHAVQRSYEVLTDDAKRERYDKTGDTEGPSIDEQVEMVLGMALHILDEIVIGSADVDQTDIGELIKRRLAQDRQKIQAPLDQLLRNIARNKRLRKGMKRRKGKKKGAGGDMLLVVLDRQLDAMQTALAQTEAVMDIHAKVEAVFEGWDYEFTPPPPPPVYGDRYQTGGLARGPAPTFDPWTRPRY